MNIRINGAPAEVPEGCTVAEAVRLNGGDAPGRSVAVAVDDMFVPRERWTDTVLTAGCDMVIIGAAYGG